MYLLRLSCPVERVDFLSGELWEAGTAGIEELQRGDRVLLAASFERDDSRHELLERFRSHSPEWRAADPIDWVQKSRAAWPPRCIGERLFLVPPWSDEATPSGRLRIVQKPGLACGTGEHPCTQLALAALETRIIPNSRVVDVGTGSGILAIAAARLGARVASGADIDLRALGVARGNFSLNEVTPELICGSADAMADHCADITVANIAGTVLLSIVDDLIRITRSGGWLILTGFPDSEVHVFEKMFPSADVSKLEEWRCLAAKIS